MREVVRVAAVLAHHLLQTLVDRFSIGQFFGGIAKGYDYPADDAVIQVILNAVGFPHWRDFGVDVISMIEFEEGVAIGFLVRVHDRFAVHGDTEAFDRISSEEPRYELQPLMRISTAVSSLQK